MLLAFHQGDNGRMFAGAAMIEEIASQRADIEKFVS
jgi:hypothetical protein